MRQLATSGSAMATTLGQLEVAALASLRANQNWQAAQYNATARDPPILSMIGFWPGTSKGSAPRMNTNGARSPKPTNSKKSKIRLIC